jgi:hypothetical protein
MLVLRQAESCRGPGPGLYLQYHAGDEAERVIKNSRVGSRLVTVMPM